MKNTINLLSILLLAFFCAAVAFGQTDTGSTGGTTFRGLKNKPYSAESIRESVQTLADGNKITRTVKTLEYRDGEGRTRREEVSQTPPPPYEYLSSINIFDPVAGYSYTLNPAQKTVTRTRFLTLAESAGFNAVTRPGYTPQKEPLGSRTIEGIITNGTRYKRIIAPGTFGNEKEIQISSETWYSPELSLTLLFISEDPRYGITTTRLTNIKRDEPDKSLFEIPADYKITDREPVLPPIATPPPATGNSNENKKP